MKSTKLTEKSLLVVLVPFLGDEFLLLSFAIYLNNSTNLNKISIVKNIGSDY